MDQKGTFVSCGYFKIIPTEGGYSNLDAKNYKTNGVAGGNSGFKIVNENLEKVVNGKTYRYLVGKSVVPGIGQDDAKLFTMKIITVAFDNESKLFNEYQTFPYQVQAMTDLDPQGQSNYSVIELQKKFVELVLNKTCLQIPHGNNNPYPAGCNGAARAKKPDSKVSQSKNLFDWFIPTTHAALPPEDIDPDTEMPTSGAYVGESMPYTLLDKLLQIPDEEFQSYIRTALVPNIIEVFKSEKER